MRSPMAGISGVSYPWDYLESAPPFGPQVNGGKWSPSPLTWKGRGRGLRKLTHFVVSHQVTEWLRAPTVGRQTSFLLAP